MRKLAAFGIVLALAAGAQAAVLAGDVISIDLGGNQEGQSPTGDNWNNFGDGTDRFGSGDVPATLLSDLIRRSDGAGTGVDLVLVSINDADGNESGTAATSFGTGAGFPESATQDVFFISDKSNNDMSLVFELRGLDPALTYDMTLFGKDDSADDNRAVAIFTDTTFAGGVSDSYDPDNNTSDTAVLSALSPDANGTLQITWTMGQGGGTSSLLSLVEVSAIPEPATMGLLAMGGLAVLRRRRK